MKNEIQSRSYFLTGLSLTVKIPENEVDKNALYTIQADCPKFILPFNCKNSDGNIELIYKIGTLCKLQYLSGDLKPKEYADLWQSLLEPLLICTDWFMNPRSFVLNIDYLYYDKNKKSVVYMYIPSIEGSFGYDAFYKMAVEISKLMTVSDTVLENKILRAIMKDFNPLEFLQMIKKHVSECFDSTGYTSGLSIKNEPDEKLEPTPKEKNIFHKKPGVSPKSETGESFLSFINPDEDTIIDLQPETKQEHRKKEKEAGGYRFFGNKSKKNKVIQHLPQETDENKINREITAADKPVSTNNNHMELTDETQKTSIIQSRTGLRYIGNLQLPSVIHVQIKEGEVYSIGRYDAAVGKKQSSFEFDKKTKAVSRRHAVVTRKACGYDIIDLASSAGTFVNDKKLPPNTPFELETGFRVSFGNSGADYVWETN